MLRPAYAPDGHGAVDLGSPPGLRTRIDCACAPLNDIDQYRFIKIAQPSSERKRYAVLEAERSGTRVMLKAFWDEPTEERSKRTVHETRVYQHLHERARGALGGLPNVVPWVETIRIEACNAKERAAASPASSAARQFWTQLSALKRPDLGKDLVVLVTEFAVGAIPLADFVRSRMALREGVMRNIIAQLMLAIHLLQRNGVTHNDMHAGNILIQPSGLKGTLLYSVKGEELAVQNPPKVAGSPKVLIFDLDLASCPTCGENDLEEPCLHRGVCDQLNPKFDVYLVTRFLLSHAPLNDEERAFLTQIVPRKVYEEVSTRMCNTGKSRRRSGCQKWPRGEPRGIMSVHDVVQLKAFFEPYVLQ